jgi:enamine deaminase RidA (YjgF/YER057c/UK114 family)
MPRELIDPPGVVRMPDLFTNAVRARGTFVFFSDQVPMTPDLEIVGGDDVGAQTAAAMRNLEIVMRAAGAGWDDLVQRTVYTTRPYEYDAIKRAILEVSGPSAPPAQTIIGAAALAVPELLVVIDAVACLDHDSQGASHGPGR